MDLNNFVVSAVLLLVVTSITVTLFKYLGLGSLLGLLVAGVIVGPHSPGPYITTHVDDVRHFTELGVVFLLFLIGLEMKPARLWALRREVFGLGSLQILLTGAGIAVYWALSPASWPVAILIGFTLALSSTAFVMQLLQERGEIASRQGTTAFAILLMQDLAIVPLLAMVPLLSDAAPLAAAVPLWERLLIVIGLLGALWVFGRFLVPFALERLARLGHRDGFLTVVLLAVFFPAWVVHEAGLSMALGAFVTGLLLSGSRYSLQVQVIVEPYKGLMMSLFFVAVGMSIDLGALAAQPFDFLRQVSIIVLIKLAVMFGLALAFGLPRQIATRVAFLLAQGGEFGFVLLGSAKALQVIDDATFVVAIGVISISMLITPLLVRIGDTLAQRLEPATPLGGDGLGYRHADQETTTVKVILGGYGRVGHIVATLLHNSGIPFIGFDTKPARVAQGKADGFPIFYGDIGDAELLQAAHVEQASLVVLTIDHEPTSLRAIAHLRHSHPALPIIVRARDLEASGRLIEAGATLAYPEAIESSLRLAAQALEMLGVPVDNVDLLLHGVRAENYELVREPPAAPTPSAGEGARP